MTDSVHVVNSELPIAMATRLQRGENRIVVSNCPYCNNAHYHGDGTFDGSGKVNGSRVADCGMGNYRLVEKLVEL